MIQLREYVKVQSLEEAYQLNQKKPNILVGGMQWIKMSSKAYGTAIDLSGLGLDKIIETEDSFEIGCMVSLRDLELHAGLNAYSNGAISDSVRDIVGVQFRNTATIGGSIFGRFGFSDVLTVFMAMDTTVVCYKAGEIPLVEFAQMKRDRDIIEKIIVRKKPIKIAYQAIRKARTDFPVLACAVSNLDGKWLAVIGSRPARAVLVSDEGNILKEGFTEAEATSFGEAVASKLTFGSDLRGSAEYRRMTTPVLVRRALMKIAEQ